MDQPVSADDFMIDTRYGRLAATGDRDIVGRFLVRCGEWAWDETSFVASVLPENARVLDVGAFLGTFGLGLALRERLDFLCLVEANPTVVPLLKANIDSNVTLHAVVVNAMVTGSPTTPRAGLTDPTNLGATSFADKAAAAPQSAMLPERAMTLAELRAEYGDFDLIKLDVEGMEQEILGGDCEHLARGDTTLWVECNESPQSLDLAKMLLSWGLGVYYFAFPSHNPDNFRGEDEPIFPWAYEAGLLVAPRTPPQLDATLIAHRCILRPVKTVEDLREALWRTPRWLPAELAHAEAPELAAAASRALRGQDYNQFLIAGAEAPPAGSIWDRQRAAEAGLAQAQALALERMDQLQREHDQREAAEAGLARAEALAFERLDQLQREHDRREAAEAGLARAEALAFERLDQLQREHDRREAAEAGLARAEALAFERLDQLQQEHDRREAADRRLADMTARALARLAEIGIERERADRAAEQVAAAEAAVAQAAAAAEAAVAQAVAAAEAAVAEAQTAIARAEASTRAAAQKAADIEMAILWRLALPINNFVSARPRLHGALRRARRIGGVLLGRR
jgi:FkbM family methyltransferase